MIKKNITLLLFSAIFLLYSCIAVPVYSIELDEATRTVTFIVLVKQLL